MQNHVIASPLGHIAANALGDRPAPRGGGCVPLTVASCFKGQVESDFDKGRRGIHGSCVVGVHMVSVEILHHVIPSLFAEIGSETLLARDTSSAM